MTSKLVTMDVLGDVNSNVELFEVPEGLPSYKNHLIDMAKGAPSRGTINVISQDVIEFEFPNTPSSPYIFFDLLDLEVGVPHNISFYVTLLSASENRRIWFTHGIRNGGYADKTTTLEIGERTLVSFNFVPQADVGGVRKRLILFTTNQVYTPTMRFEGITIVKGDEPKEWVPSPIKLGYDSPIWLDNFKDNVHSEKGITSKGFSDGVNLQQNIKSRYINGELETVESISEYPNILENGLVLWYDFKGKTNTGDDREIVEDLSGNNNDGEMIGFQYTDTSGFNNGKLTVDGVNDKVVIPHSPKLFIRNDLTIELRIKRLGGLSGINKGATGAWASNSYGVRSGSNQLQFFIVDVNGVLNQYSTDNIAIGEELSLTCVTSNSQKKVWIYKDGELNREYERTTGTIREVTGRSNSLYIGENYTNNYGNMEYSSIRIYNRALTAEEVKYNYEAEKGRW